MAKKPPSKSPPKSTPAPVKDKDSAPVQNRHGAPFDWHVPKIPGRVQDGFREQALLHKRAELRERASLLRRLGYSESETLRRLSAYDAWEYEPFHSSPLATEIARLVAEIYESKQARSTSLSPGK